jgi:hypothetical protein
LELASSAGLAKALCIRNAVLRVPTPASLGGAAALADGLAHVYRGIFALREHAHLGVDTQFARSRRAGSASASVLSCGLMLYADWLLLARSWRQIITTAGD